MVECRQMNQTIQDILNIMKISPGQAEGVSADLIIIKSQTPAFLERDKQTGKAYIRFQHKGKIYRTVLRGKHQALNAAFCIEVARRLGVQPDVVEKALVTIPLDGRFETIRKSPQVIFDIVQSAEDMKNFANCACDYFGREVQNSMRTPTNVRPEPFRRLIIADVFYPDLVKVKQGTTIIFTDAQMQRDYLALYNKQVKTLVMPIETAINYAVTNYPTHKIFIIGAQGLFEKAKKLVAS